MEKIEGELEVFSSILLQEYIRLMTASCYINNEKCSEVRFKITADVYGRMLDEPLQAPLIGLNLSYDKSSETLSVMADSDFVKAYQDKNLKEVALKYAQNYLKRYKSNIIMLS